MLCENPYYAVFRYGQWGTVDNGVRSLIKPTDDHKLLFFYVSDYGGLHDYTLMRFPCRECLPCRWERTNEWSLRCKLEAQRYKNNLFVTLTYGRQGRVDAMLSKTDLSRFIHALREHFRRKFGLTEIRFFGCGEYGKETLRPHYHLILFNCPRFGDEKFYKKDKAGYPLYKSKILEHLWGKGFCSIGEVSDKSIDYVARTLVKSYYIKPPDDYEKAFISMSKQGGIGTQYLMEHFDEIVKDDCIVYDGKKYSIPRSFNRIIQEKIGKEEYIKRFVLPRKERAGIAIAKDAYEKGVSPDEAVQLHRADIVAYVHKLIAHDEETQF